ncbi:MAG: nuclear transport factor 2 family protein [Planctomycetaceae bacterium]|nr:nuclear transport factor 2 family protein [Planctomycetaceae bacterium]
MLTEIDKSTEEAQIRRLCQALQTAVQSRDLDGLMACYDRDVVVFDMIAPLQYNGIEAYRGNWQSGFNCMSEAVEFEIRDLHVTAGDEIAFCHALNHLGGMDNRSEPFDNWVRWTAGLHKRDGRWLIAHEHVSIPIDMQTGRGLGDLKP